MQHAKLRYKFYLHRRKITVLFFLLFSFASMEAQLRKSGVTLHRLNSDQKMFKYGFMIGLHRNFYGIKYADRFGTAEFDQLAAILPGRNFGFDLGFMVNLRLADQLSIRLEPVKIGLYQHTVEYMFINGNTNRQLIESTRIEPGVFLKYRSIRRSNFRMYLTGGISGSIRSGKEDLITAKDRLEIRSMDFRVEAGVGLDYYFEFFTFSPELRYAMGILNVMNTQDNLFHNGLKRINTHNFTLYFYFSD